MTREKLEDKVWDIAEDLNVLERAMALEYNGAGNLSPFISEQMFERFGTQETDDVLYSYFNGTDHRRLLWLDYEGQKITVMFFGDDKATVSSYLEEFIICEVTTYIPHVAHFCRELIEEYNE